MSMYVCSCKKWMCKCPLRIIVSGMMTQEELDFAKVNRERIAEIRKIELIKEKEQELLWEKKQEKLLEKNLKLWNTRNQDKAAMILKRKLMEN